MLSSSNLNTARRRLCLGLAAWPLLAWARPDPLAGLRRWGHGEYRRYGFLVYEATLWAGDDSLRPPLALRLDYRRNITGRAIGEASIREMRNLGGDEAPLPAWGEQLAALLPDVTDGDHILGLYRPEGARFYFNGRDLGGIADGEFARRFFAIWLDPRTSAPTLRAALLRLP